MFEIFIDAFKDSILTLPVLFICYLLIELLEEKILSKYKSNKLKGKFTPIVSAGFGLIPQCGFSVVASELYSKRIITIGSLFAILIATSDEALPIMLSNPSSYLDLVIILSVKFVYAIIVGLTLDFLVSKFNNKKNIELENNKDELTYDKHSNIIENNTNSDEKIDLEDIHGCCHHALEHKKNEKLKELFIHPLLHSIKIFAFIFVVNIIFGFIIYYVGENAIFNFMQNTGFFEPFIVSIVGAIPNCAASVIITEFFLSGGISIGSCIAGLCMNSGLALVMLFRFNKNIKQNICIVFLLYALSCILGVIINLF